MTIRRSAGDQRALANELDSYMRFRADKEGVGYSLSPQWFEGCLRLGAEGFFGVMLGSKQLIRDTQNPNAFAEWRRTREAV